jgi:hypothetical protein
MTAGHFSLPSARPAFKFELLLASLVYYQIAFLMLSRYLGISAGMVTFGFHDGEHSDGVPEGLAHYTQKGMNDHPMDTSFE